MKKIIYSLIFFSIGFVNAQNNYSVIYKLDKNFELAPSKYKKNDPPSVKERLVFNDSLSYGYFMDIYEKDPIGKSTVFGDKIFNHCYYNNKNTGISYVGATWNTRGKKYLIVETAIYKDWIFINETKNILGYNCKAAINISSENDSLLVWYTAEIAVPFGPVIYYGLPGLVLEVFNQKSDQHIKAIRIEKGDYTIIMPADGIIISAESFRNRIR